MRFKTLYLAAAALFIGLAPPSEAQDVVSTNDGLECVVRGKDVKLSWNIHFIAPIRAWVICRDGEPIATLEPEATGWREWGVEAGEHIYELKAVNFDGDILKIANCTVVVGDFDLVCRVDVNDVYVQWQFPPIDVAFREFVIRRDGVEIGTTDPDTLIFADRGVPIGTYRYTVTGRVSPRGPEFLVGACTVEVTETRFVCRVDPPLVHLDWSRIPVIEIVHYYVIVRNGQRIGRTRASQFKDEPGPGEHHYVVYFVPGEPPSVGPVADVDLRDELSDRGVFKIGECKIVMPDEGPPPPEELTCVDLDSEGRIDLADDELLEEHDVLLVWQKPVEYDRVLITRNDDRIAVIDGSQFYYVDRGVDPGRWVYKVYGVVGDQISRPAECIVDVPFPVIEPPRDLTCTYIGPIDGEPVDPVGVAGVEDDAVSPTSVALRWVNGQRYDFIVVVVNGHALTRLAGGATAFRHHNPAPGINKYQVFGVVGFRRSQAAECSVRVPPQGPPPPVRNLRCAVIEPVPEREPGDAIDPNVADAELAPDDPTIAPRRRVLLRWELPAIPTPTGDEIAAGVYDRIQVTRNNVLIATLPGNATSYTDHPPFSSGGVTYCVIGIVDTRRSEPSCCDVDLGPPVIPPPQDLKCEVFQRPLTDEELALIDDPDLVDPTIPVSLVRLQWANPVRYGRIIISRDGEVIARLEGSSTVYLDVRPPLGPHTYCAWGISADGVESRKVCCDVVVDGGPVPPVEELTCVSIQATADGLGSARLRWVNGADDYSAIFIERHDGEAFRLIGSATEFRDHGLQPGVYEYEVYAIRGNRRSAGRECRVIIDGPPSRNLLFFSSGLFETDPTDERPVAVDPNGSITCMASNSDPIQGWSFGVCSDPSVLKPTAVSIEDTTAGDLNSGRGPEFLVIDRHVEGVTMAAVIDNHDVSETLPPGSRHSLLRIKYEPGPDAEFGVRYSVRYCDVLGEPPVAVLYVVRGFDVEPDTAKGFVSFREPGPRFIRGDANDDGDVGMADAAYLFSWLFLGGRPLKCQEAGDANSSRTVNLADGIYILQWRFLGGPPPNGPFPGCGIVQIFLSCEQSRCDDIAL